MGNERSNTPDAERTCDTVSADSPDREDYTSDTQSQSEDEWHPGDGVCPSTSQFIECYNHSWNIWSSAVSTPPGHKSAALYLESFLAMVENVPPFFHNPPEGVNIVGGSKSPLILQSSFHLKTSDHIDCDQREKTFKYLQCFAFASPMVYKTTTESHLGESTPSRSSALQSGQFTTIVLAWSYIVSSRWVEILQKAGWNSMILHDQSMQMTDCFWDMIVKGLWQAKLRTKKGTHYSPWMLRDNSRKEKVWYVKKIEFPSSKLC